MSTNLPVLLFALPFIASLFAAAGGWLVHGSARWIALATLAGTAALSIHALPRVLTEGSLHTHTASRSCSIPSVRSWR
jgi:hypothetical protein